ncbi:MAG: phosphoribosylaminoimidazolesuccinocarboxamide synthase [Patescibacteria group bacterium]|nr:phosphoribosylaminoimidazolesuccinocarboxamide synthase [Patescibacteria group bacterium]
MAVLKSISLSGFGRKMNGKVRDYYEHDGKLILITTDRISAFDRVLGTIAHKGQVLNQLASFWFEQVKDIVPHHLISTPDPNVSLVKKCSSLPIEMVVRGYMTGSTITSIWHNYQKGERMIYGLKFPGGMKKNQALPKPIITPTTRGTGVGGHDEKISKAEIIKRNIITKDIYEQMETVALAIFERGRQICLKSGLILVDTKYEFGLDHGQLTLIDEVHTPDSSRFWMVGTYPERLEKGLEPENFDKEFFRLWYAKKGYQGDGTAPVMPQSFRDQVSRRYLDLYQMITGQALEITPGNISSRIKQNLQPLLDEVVILAGSLKDEPFIKKIHQALTDLKLKASIYYASAHKQPLEVLAVMKRYQQLNKKYVFITVAGRSNALSGFVAANSNFPVLACPPLTDKLDYLVNIHSSLQMPSGVPVMTVIDPGNVALAAKRILADA